MSKKIITLSLLVFSFFDIQLRASSSQNSVDVLPSIVTVEDAVIFFNSCLSSKEQISIDADESTINKAFKKASLRCHPDKRGSKETMNKLTQAKDVIEYSKVFPQFQKDFDEILEGGVNSSKFPTLDSIKFFMQKLPPDVKYSREVLIAWKNQRLSPAWIAKIIATESLDFDLKFIKMVDLGPRVQKINYEHTRNALIRQYENRLLCFKIATFGRYTMTEQAKLEQEANIQLFPRVIEDEEVLNEKIEDLRKKVAVEKEKTDRALYAATGTVAAVVGGSLFVGGLIARSICLDK